jgi:hypothetical protein
VYGHPSSVGQYYDTAPYEQQELASEITVLKNENERVGTLLRDLQQERLGALDDFQPRSDADLREAIMKLQYQVTSFSRYLRGSRSLNSEKIRGALEGLALTDGNTKDVRLTYFLESVLWTQVMAELFVNPFQPFGEKSRIIMDAWCAIFGTGKLVN